MTKRVEHERLMKSKVPCLSRFVAILVVVVVVVVAIVFNSFVSQGAQNYFPVLATSKGNTPGITNLTVPLTHIINVDEVLGNDSAANSTNGVAYSTLTNAIANIQDNTLLQVRSGKYWTFTRGSPGLFAAASNGPNFRLTGKTNVVLKGIGQPIIQYTNVGTILQLWDVKDFVIDGFTFECTNKCQGTALSNLVTCIDLSGNTCRGTIKNCKFIDFHDHGIVAGLNMNGSRNAVSNIFCFNNEFYRGGQTSGVVSLVFDGTAIAPGTGWWTEQCYFEGCFRGVEIQPNLAVDNFINGAVVNCKFRRMLESSVIFIGAGSADSMLNWKVKGNHIFEYATPFDGNYKSAIALIGGGAGFLDIDGNDIDDQSNSLGYGINIVSTGGSPTPFHDVEIKNNFISGGVLGIGAAGISVYGASPGLGTNISVVNNYIEVGPVAAWGIVYTAGGGTISRNRIKMQGNPSNFAGVGLPSSINETVDVRITDNLVLDSGNYGYYIYLGSSNNFLYNNHAERYGSVQMIADLNPKGFNKIEVSWNGNIPFKGTNQLGPIAITSSLANLWSAGTTVTNTGAVTNNLITGPIDGSLTLGVDYWKRNKTAMLKGRGRYWTTATPGLPRIMVNYDGAGTTTSNTLTQTFFTPPGSITAGLFTFEISVTCTNVSTSGGIIAGGWLDTVSGNSITRQTFTNTVTSINTIANASFSMCTTNNSQIGMVVDEFHLNEN